MTNGSDQGLVTRTETRLIAVIASSIASIAIGLASYVLSRNIDVIGQNTGLIQGLAITVAENRQSLDLSRRDFEHWQDKVEEIERQCKAVQIKLGVSQNEK